MTVAGGERVGGRYRLVEVIGQGGMGRVWRAEDEVLGRRVAVKQVLLAPDLPAEDRARLIRRNRTEAEAAARLHHPGIVTVHDVIDHAGTPWIVMEHLSGPSLATLIARRGRLQWPRAAALGAQVAEALAHAHARGVVHRDLKPDNILMEGDRAVLTDFGIARILDSDSTLTSPGTVLGTPQYMPPEQLNGQKVAASGDLWALGATLYAAVEGRPPYTGDGLRALITAILTRPLPAPAHAGPLAGLLAELLTRDAGQRPTAETTARRLHALGPAPQPVPAPHTPTVPDRPGTPAPPEGEPTRTAGDRMTIAKPPPTQSRTGTPSSGRRQDSRHPTPGPGGSAQQPPGRRLVTRRTVLRRVFITAAALAGGLAALMAHPGSPPSPGPPSSSGSPASPGSPSSPVVLTAPLTGPGAGSVGSVAFSPNGNTLAASHGLGGVQLWNVATGKTTHTLTAPDDFIVKSVAFSPDGRTLAAGTQSFAAQLWNLATGRSTHTLTAPDSTVTVGSVAFSPNGKTLATGNVGTVQLWNLATGKTTHTLTGPGPDNCGVVGSVAFSPNGKTLAADDGDGTVKLWNLTTSKTHTFIGPGPDRCGVSGSVAFSPDGKTLAATNYNGTVKLWNLSTGKTTHTLTAHPVDTVNPFTVLSVAFSADGKTLAAGYDDGTVKLWNLTTGKTTATLTAPDDFIVKSVAVSPDGKTLAAGYDDGTVKLWNLHAH
ncbi:WD40 repeat domain-containing serine/threonine protein kinase [Streptomyces sp. NRRL F-5126]|uniref:WD40 repeat domain-containing serine/threonine protein kinase n=1 Tax=Streptomyces sp. NRRL F-5126 TaxID=1463857 RepID=UPI00131EA810|nr:serine/threonine-protein kinase [Streptomyces sp. NRRL F-5126]